MTIVYDANVPAAHERTMGPGNPRPRRHAENPDQLGQAMCGEQLPRDAVRTGDGECALCLAVINAGRSWTRR